MYTRILGSMLVLERLRSSLVSLKYGTLWFHFQFVLLSPGVDGKERNFMVTINNTAYSIVGARLSEKLDTIAAHFP